MGNDVKVGGKGKKGQSGEIVTRAKMEGWG